MTIKDDYIHFMVENNYILKELENNKTITYDLLQPVFDVLNFLGDCDFKVEGESVDDCTDVFETGFQYVYACLDHIKRILNENFDDDMEEFLEYDQNMYLYLRVDEIDTMLNESDQIISGILDQLQSTFEYRKKLDNVAQDMIEKEIERAQMSTDESTISDLFMDFADTLGIELI